jgi:hypothetical protein
LAGGTASAGTSADGITITGSGSGTPPFVHRDIGYAFAKFTVKNTNPDALVDENNGLTAGVVGGRIVAREFTLDGREDECGTVCYGGPGAGQTEVVNLAMLPDDGCCASSMTATVYVPYFLTGDPTRHVLRKTVTFAVR